MKKQDIKRHLQDYSIYGKRMTTINHAFASALSVADTYDENKIDNALMLLGQNPNQDLTCVYCDRPAETWDHIMAVVKDGKFSGYGHQIGNLIPCCKNCNSKKGNRDWKSFLISKRPSEQQSPDIINRIDAYIKNNTTQFEELLDSDINTEIKKLEIIKARISELMKRGDEQAKIIRDKLRAKTKSTLTNAVYLDNKKETELGQSLLEDLQKFKSPNNFVSIYFDPEPNQWGLRGDPHLWRDMKQKAESNNIPTTANKLEKLLHRLFKELVGEAPQKGKNFYVKKYETNGMSKGMISSDFWLDKGFSLIIQRYIESELR